MIKNRKYSLLIPIILLITSCNTNDKPIVITPTPLPSITSTPTPTPIPSSNIEAEETPLEWNDFKDEENKEVVLKKITWFSEKVGMGASINKGTKAKLYKTTDSGKTWKLVSEIDGKNSSSEATMDVYIFSEKNIWYSTGFSGFGFSGTIGKSVDGGKTWVDLTEVVHKAFSEEGDSVVYDFPIWNIVKSKNKIFVSSSSNYIVVSSDNGDTWSKLKTPYNINEYQLPKLIGTPDYMYLYYFNNKVNTLFIYDDNENFIESTSKLPDTSSILNVRYSPLNNGVVFFNEKYGDDIFLYSTMDGANSFEKITLKSTKDDPLVEIRDIQRFYKNDQNELYLSGIFKGIDGNNYVQIRKGINNDPLKVIYSHEHGAYQNKLTSVMIDNLNNIHALKHWTDYYGYEYNYTGNFLLEK